MNIKVAHNDASNYVHVTNTNLIGIVAKVKHFMMINVFEKAKKGNS
jgi:hypothetical protein